MKVDFRPFAPVDVHTVRQKMPYSLNESTRGIVAYDPDTTETLAIFLAEDWTQTSVSVHQVILKTMVIRHGWFEAIADYVYTQAGRKKMFAVVPDNNPRAISLNEKIGFEQVARLTDAYAEGVDYVVMEMPREKCNFWVQPKLKKVS